MKKILVIRLSAIGDVLFTLPAVAALAETEPDSRISWLVEDKAAGLLEMWDGLAETIVFPRKTIRRRMRNPILWPGLALLLIRHCRGLRRVEYDRLYDFQGNLKSGVHAFLARSRRKIGFARNHVKEKSHIFYGEKISPPAGAVHRVEKAFSLVFPRSPEKKIERPLLRISPEAEKWAAAVREEIFPRVPRIAVLHPGTSAFGAFKRWPAPRFGILAGRLLEACGVPSLVTWGPGEEGLAKEAESVSRGAARAAPRTRSLAELAALVAMGGVFVAADSGPLHLANLLGTPCLGLFGPKDPAVYGPYFQPAASLSIGLSCSPCERRRCDDPLCMTKMKVEDVFAAAAELLGFEGKGGKRREG